MAIGWLTDLVVWVERVGAVYARLMPCWPWHPVVVADLLVLRHQWALAAGDGVGPDLLAAWHDRWAPAALRRVEAGLRTCHRSSCHVEASTFSTPDRSRLDEYAYWWATTHGRPEHGFHAQAYRFDQDNVAPLHGRPSQDLPPGLIRGRR